MKSGSHRLGRPCSTLPPHKWQRMRLLQDVCHLNQHVLEVLSDLARSGVGTAPPVISENADLWASLDEASRHRAAQMPMLFLDLRFQDEKWWREVARGVVVHPDQPQSGDRAVDQVMAGFTRQALMLIWPAVREDRMSTILLFGVSEPVAGVIGAMTPRDLDKVSMRHGEQMRLRWEQSPGFWRKLLSAAQSEDMDMLRTLHLCGLQMLGGEVLRTRGGVEAAVHRDQSHRRSTPSAH